VSGVGTAVGSATGMDAAGTGSATAGGGTSSAMVCCRQKTSDNSVITSVFINMISLLYRFLSCTSQI